MTEWSRYLLGASIVFGVGTTMLAEQVPEWCGPVSILVMVLGASAFLVSSALEYRRGRVMVNTSEHLLPR
ncbi:hypothetical protein [Arthrobacter sp. NPDC092385]|jgi:hypothetical protein|uniref:hypothetical protein n=1 Tax=Arthrobacter sp. NPDC092385 TaxID=3363943 RepID=UPI0038025376